MVLAVLFVITVRRATFLHISRGLYDLYSRKEAPNPEMNTFY